MNKTALMRRVEKERGEALETLLPRLWAQMGTVETARYLGVSRSTFTLWRLLLGYGVERRLVRL